jgi:hypothetical protein
MEKTKSKPSEDWIVENIPEKTIEELVVYMKTLQKYDEEHVIDGINQHLLRYKNVDYVILRPNGVTGIISNGTDTNTLQRKYYKWGNEWIKIKR